jgi:(1->4)-alpha-D-glucan 1-alpha-D-glucosylmutase
MTDTALLGHLSRLCGIEPRYTDIWGRTNEISGKDQQSLLAAMGIAVDDDAAVRRVLHERQRRAWQQRLLPVHVLREDDGKARIVLTLPAAQASVNIAWELFAEGGNTAQGTFRAEELEIVDRAEIDGVEMVRCVLPLPHRPGCGYHRFVIHPPGEAPAETCLIIAPPACYRPPILAEGARVWGLAVQLYALRSSRNWGIGDFTDLRLLIEHCATLGASILGVNPLHALFPHNPEHASPYSPSSRLFLNVLYIDVEAVPEFTACEPAMALVAAPQFQERLRAARETDLVQYADVAELKFAALELLYAHFCKHHMQADSDRARAFRAFQEQEGDALYRHALYEALQEHFHCEDASVWGWPMWPPEYRHFESQPVSAFASAQRERLEFFEYLQWLANSQLAAVGTRALELQIGVGLYQDLAVGIDRAGAEAWAHHKLYALDASIGSPPDDYSLSGQDWGLPPLIPDALVESRYATFINTLRANMRHAGALRIDHVMGLMRLFWVPPGGKAADGGYVHYAFDDLLGILALESVRNRCMVIGEDLGTVPPEVPAALQPLGVLSYRLFYFEKDSKGELKAPDDYPAQALVAVSTHDLPTLAGFWQGQELLERTELHLFPSEEAREQQLLARTQDRARLLLALERERLLPAGVTADPASSPEMTPALSQAVHRYIARTPCQLMLVQLEDVIGQQYQVNLPGTTDQRPNWRYRLEVDIERLIDGERMRDLAAAICQERGLARETPSEPPWQPIIPHATYRLQFNRDFGFTQAAMLVPYLQRLGISHCYVSPFLKARAGSTHGYDIVDHNALNPEIGDEQEFEHFVDTLRRHGIGQILDIVPNHMGVGGDDNAWWLDVLENGPASAYAKFFDIDWRTAKPEMRDKVLLPVLGDHYGRILDSGELRLTFDVTQGTFAVRYYHHLFPVDPQTYSRILSYELEVLSQDLSRQDLRMMEFQSLITAFRNLPRRGERVPARLEERRRDKEVHKKQLAELYRRSSAIARFIERNVSIFNGTAGSADSFDTLHALLDEQPYRLAHWRVAADEINYRRFFDINDLAGLRMENVEVFEATHRFVIDLIAKRKLDGLRIDHPDGLYDPLQYYQRLQQRVAAALAGAQIPTKALAEAPNTRALYVVVEKILAGHEHLPESWPVFGTTGYDFANLVNGLFVFAPAERAMERIYARVIGRTTDFDELLYERKRLIMRVSLSSELHVLANQLSRIAESDRHTRDFTLTALREALMEVVARFPVYRTYVRADGASTEDRRDVDWAVAQAKKNSPAAEISIFDFVKSTLLLEGLEQRPPDYRQAATDFAMRFQQYTAPVMAKGLEDTSFYIYNRLVSVNEVGGDPKRFAVSIAAFHHANQERVRRWPHTMLATSTHDSKRSEDVRARINVLSELAGEWREHLARWRRLNRRKKRRVGERWAPSANDEYLLYQALVGAWPLEAMDEGGLGTFRERIKDYMLKAIREAKVHTSWINPNTDYEQAVVDFVGALLASMNGNPFLNDFVLFQKRIARLGMFNSLSQVLLKLTSPGVPDLYQGNEIWDFSLVDPDNRRPVDYTRREALLQELDTFTNVADSELAIRARALVDNMEDGRIKLYVTWRLLDLRQQYTHTFRDGNYTPLEIYGANAEHLCAFARGQDPAMAISVAPRWLARLSGTEAAPPLGKVWQDTWIQKPPQSDRRFVNVFTGEEVKTEQRDGKAVLPVVAVLANVPVAVLTSLPD